MSRRELTMAAPRAKRSETLREVTYEAIKLQIITCEIKPGEYVNELQLARRLRIGRTPVHQALTRLMNDGMVDVIPRKGVIVRPISLNEILHIIHVRLVNACYCALLAAERADDKDIASLRNVSKRARHCLSTGDIKALVLLDLEFHSLIASAARNVVLAELLRTLHERSLRLWLLIPNALDHGESMLQQHEAILQAICDRDAKKAETAMRQHIEAFRSMVCNYF